MPIATPEVYAEMLDRAKAETGQREEAEEGEEEGVGKWTCHPMNLAFLVHRCDSASPFGKVEYPKRKMIVWISTAVVLIHLLHRAPA